MSDNRLEAVVQQWSTRSAPAEVVALAEAARQRHNGVAAVLFYGSWLRSSRVDEGIADLYLLVDNYYNAFGSHFQALMNRLLPPNVFYLEIPYAEKTLRAKYAVLTLEDFVKGAGRWFHSYIWGRFSQPCGLIYVRSDQDLLLIRQALTSSVLTFVRRALPQVPETFTIRELWGTGLSLSYRCELRSENRNLQPGSTMLHQTIMKLLQRRHSEPMACRSRPLKEMEKQRFATDQIFLPRIGN